MDWLQQNLDAYRVVTEILNDLRTTVRQELELNQGKLWYRTGLPQGVLDRLIERKEKEKAIDWYESEYQQLIDFASFADILEILEHNTDLVPPLRRLAPNTALLHARFLELEVMREKLAMTRPISEAELGFLTTFHSRFRKAIEQVKVQDDAAAAAVSATSNDEAREEAARDEAPTPQSDVSQGPSPAQESGEPTEPETEVEAGDREETNAAEAEAESNKTSDRRESRPPSRSAFVPQSSKPSPAPPKAPSRPGGRAATAVAEAPEPESKRSVKSQLEENDTKAILRSLYREVTTVAEGLWTSDIPPATAIWNHVRVHPWYEQNISKLGLKPLSDFYEIISKVEDKMNGGIARDQLQDFLKESNFAKVLLSLRDMFQRNGI